MPCSCGNTACLCGIPCSCSEETCKCDDCSIALQRLCKICNNPLITDMQTNTNVCSCFEGDSAALTLENSDNPEWIIGNIPLPDCSFVHGKLIVNMIIPIQRFPPLTSQQPINSMPSPALIPTDSSIALPSDKHEVTSLPLGEDSGIPSTEELDKSSEQTNHEASSGNCSTTAQNSETSSKETCPSLTLESTGEEKTANVEQSSKSEMEGHATVQESSFYLPSISIGDISYPVRLTDPVWILPNPENSNSIVIRNPFYSTRPAHTMQTMTNFGDNCRQEDSNFNNYNGLALEDSIAFLNMNGQLSDQTKIIEQSGLEINEHVKMISSCVTGTGSTFFSYSDSVNSIDSISTNKWTPFDFDTLPINGEILGKYSMHDKTDVNLTDISLSGTQEVPGIKSQVAGFSASGSLNNATHEARSFTGERRANMNSRNPHQSPSTTLNMLGGFNFPNTTTLQDLINMQNKENKHPQSGNFCSSVNDSIPLYVDPFTTQKMEKLLKTTINPRTPLSPSHNVTFSTQNSVSNKEFSNSIFKGEQRR